MRSRTSSAVERDITDELRLRDQLVHSERLSAVGELVAGVAHEINNPLQTIVGCVELMLEERADAGRCSAISRSCGAKPARAGQIVRNLLSFVRRSAPDRAPADLNEIVRRRPAAARVPPAAAATSRCVVRCTGEPLPVLVNREEIQQVVLNLLLNAEQAIDERPGAAAIAIRTLQPTGASTSSR